jgi:DUF1365 family protein
MYLDLAELPTLFDRFLFWSGHRPNLAWFDRRDHLGDPALPLDTAVRELVARDTGRRPVGPIRLLTHMKYFGYCMNPVSFYYCFDPAGQALEYVVAEINNTPWGERHCYTLDLRGDHPGWHVRRFAKAFHVSPFFPLTQEYRWRLSEPDERLVIAMENREEGHRVFTATMVLQARAINAANLHWVLVRHPFMTGQVIAAIYWQALRLWLKGTPFHPHPPHRQTPIEYRAGKYRLPGETQV